MKSPTKTKPATLSHPSRRFNHTASPAPARVGRGTWRAERCLEESLNPIVLARIVSLWAWQFSDSLNHIGARVDSSDMKTMILLSCLVVAGCSNQTASEQKQDVGNDPPPLLATDLPEMDPSWIHSFEEEIKATRLKLKRRLLKDQELAEDDIEVRLWSGLGGMLMRPDGFPVVEGVIMTRENGNWQGEHLAFSGKTLDLTAPNSGWEGLWEMLVHQELLTLPDTTQLPKDRWGLVPDGTYTVVELHANGSYRTYHFHNIDSATLTGTSGTPPRPEASRLQAIVGLLRSEFAEIP